MNSASAPRARVSELPPTHPGMILRFVDAFPAAAAAVKQPRKARGSRRKGAAKSEAAGQTGPNADGVLMMRL